MLSKFYTFKDSKPNSQFSMTETLLGQIHIIQRVGIERFQVPTGNQSFWSLAFGWRLECFGIVENVNFLKATDW